MEYITQAADYVLPIIECDGYANVRAKPSTRSEILTQLNYESSVHKILGKQGNWYRIELENKKSGFVHQSQIILVQHYVVDSKDGSANVRNAHFPDNEPIGKREIMQVLPNGTRVQIVPAFNKGDWLFYTNQGAYDSFKEHSSSRIEAYIHKSQLRKVD